MLSDALKEINDRLSDKIGVKYSDSFFAKFSWAVVVAQVVEQ